MDTETTYQLLDGKRCSEALKQSIAEGAAAVKSKRGRPPHLAAILVGNDGASKTYVEAKVKACEQVGFRSSLIRLPETITEEELLSRVEALNADAELDGFIVQLPLPTHLNADRVVQAIDPRKDVDGFHPVNVGNMVLGLPGFLPATPSGICELLRFYHIETDGKRCVVLGRSNIVGTPMSILMSRNAYPGNCTVTLAHSRTKDLASITREADIVIVAIGKPQFLKADMVKEGVVVVDVGIHRVQDTTRKSGFRLVGDVAFNEVATKCKAITPVPGGVGPMTITSLLLNTLKASR
ncbi:MAG: bifunctional 5,10-methylene-tetrahydrofolate dehydrogenase/5,10-methylene-tetrahydrofolate cyclohydrolase [Flavobacteriales bacterium]|jgi:methylenetetrahydrofolate dehydrogenase (NADP+)/methenyltetrahydrofolate cyclohydrolase|nr:bifunctional 5,10-methylene-tetrahydrofolate dehydrogenase/5,10-methylene-tetrahydrofolate cyclohydrolase [Flavobacteriales bacterium]MBK6883114.1 bifunctional 5,10-methylene-tetrahydrofolate dehydrogenase/5,10-methylene-tetrahydrofolate cyclohydrolase [Flavobacteriales bacterium]MBK7620260.1 bifunctional 5,10-methylene-tetrahydrofolate dehydrogenase/5,10-methylene-tetrahydrofolate cyclohydrolase [Flavobacteriales bacterium]MBK8707277.1 bifunctional 5,10-methylene-tetrahydrofolate dehydrogena